MDFQIGDRVRAVMDYFPGLVAGEYGTVVGYDAWDDPVVEWDEFSRERHDCDGMTKSGHGWFINNKYIELAKPNDLGDLPAVNPEESSKFLFDI